LQFFAAKDTDLLAGVNPVGIGDGDLLILFPQVRPDPGGIIEMLREVPEGITLYDGVVEA
jgi:hypothetical protein